MSAERKTIYDPPRGVGSVMAFSITAGKWVKVNCKYVRAHADIYTKWKPTSSFKWRTH